MIEEWRRIEAHPDYAVSSLGRIKSFKRSSEGILRKVALSAGYYSLTLDGHYTCTVHRLVAVTFIPNPDNKSTVNHKDKNRLNNYIDNLEWMNVRENIAHGRNKPIHQISPETLEIVKTFESKKLAVVELNLNNSNVGRAARLGLLCGGYYWEYATISEL